MKKLILPFLLITKIAIAQTFTPEEKLKQAQELIYANSFANPDTGKINQALDLLAAVKNTNVNTAVIFLTEGEAYLLKKNYTKAIASLNKSLLTDSVNFITYEKLHWIYFYGLSDSKQALLVRKKAQHVYLGLVKQDTLNARSWFLLGKSYNLCDYTSAGEELLIQKYLNKAVELEPGNSIFLFESYWNDTNKNRGFEKLKKALELKENYLYRLHYCQALIDRKEYKLAVAEATKGITIYPNQFQLYDIRATAYKSLKDYTNQNADVKKSRALTQD
jgi:predicted Zn-dependent protease